MDEETEKFDERGERRFNDRGVDAKGRFRAAEIDKKVYHMIKREATEGDLRGICG
jgi:hypothetical protein